MYQETVVKPSSPVFMVHMVSCADRPTRHCGSLCNELLQFANYSMRH